MLSVASVMMKGWGSRPHTYTAPFTKPTVAPLAIITTMTTQPELPCAYANAPSTEANASVEPTDRSMPRVRITKQLADRQHRDRCSLGEQVPRVASGEKDWRQHRHRDDQPSKDQYRTEPDYDQREAQQPVVTLLTVSRVERPR